MQQIILRTWDKVCPVDFLSLVKQNELCLELLCVHPYAISSGRQSCTDDKTDNTNTRVLLHIASELADTYSYYLNELWLRTTKDDVR